MEKVRGENPGGRKKVWGNDQNWLLEIDVYLLFGTWNLGFKISKFR
jgi:hypothetical protein